MLTWEQKIKMAKEAKPELTDDQAAEVVRDLERFAHFALEQYHSQRKNTPGEQA